MNYIIIQTLEKIKILEETSKSLDIVENHIINLKKVIKSISRDCPSNSIYLSKEIDKNNNIILTAIQEYYLSL